jgi:hypothetical protein
MLCLPFPMYKPNKSNWNNGNVESGSLPCHSGMLAEVTKKSFLCWIQTYIKICNSHQKIGINSNFLKTAHMNFAVLVKDKCKAHGWIQRMHLPSKHGNLK